MFSIRAFFCGLNIFIIYLVMFQQGRRHRNMIISLLMRFIVDIVIMAVEMCTELGSRRCE